MIREKFQEAVYVFSKALEIANQPDNHVDEETVHFNNIFIFQ